jgi:glycoprotein 3-alpha-L-fucosyltransferase
MRCLATALTIVWLVLSLYISGNPELRLGLASWELAEYAERFLRDDWNFDIELSQTMRRLRLSTPSQEKPAITIANAPPHMVGHEFEHCELSCNMRSGGADDSDGSFGSSDPSRGILFTMESITNYPHFGYERSKGTHRIVMNTQLVSDIPLHYNNWEYQYLRPIEHEIKPEPAMASAFVSNCGARSFRLRAIEALIANNVTIEQYGNCNRTKQAMNGNDKLATIARHIFTLAFENSEEEDYVTEKFFQALEAGTIPVSLGAPNIDDYAPQPETYLHLRTIEDVPGVAARMREIAGAPSLRRHYLRYKTEGLSDKFLALTDMTVPHTFCQACYILADDRNDIRGRARRNATACRATIPRASTTVHRFYVRERTQFVYRELFVSSKFDGFEDVTYEGFLADLIGVFRSYRPTWTYYRDEKGHNLNGGNATEPFSLRVHRICDRYTNVKTCLYSNDSPLVLRDDSSLRRWLAENPCGELAVVFV